MLFYFLPQPGSTHFGIAGWYSARALQQGMIVSKHEKMLAVWFSLEIRSGYVGDTLRHRKMVQGIGVALTSRLAPAPPSHLCINDRWS